MRFNNRYNLTELAARIAAATMGPGQFDAFAIENAQSVLETCVDFNPQVPEADRRGLVWEGIVAASEAGAITVESLTDSLRQVERAYLRKPLESFVLATSASLPRALESRVFRFDGATVTVSRSLPPRFSRRAVQEEVSQYTRIERPGDFMAVRVRVEARTHPAAVAQGLDKFDLLRGIWNYSVNRRTLMRHGGPERPINSILLGPVHTLHNPRGALATDILWYEPAHRQFEYRPDVNAQWEPLLQAYEEIRKKLQRVPYADELNTLFIRYCRALDPAEFDVAFNKLWAVFEHLGDKVGAYADLIERVLFLYRATDRAYAKLILEHLRDVRNGLVHFDRDRDEIRSYTYQLKGFVEALFRYHLRWGKNYGSLKAAAAFLDNPKDTNMLAERIREYRHALRFLGDG